MLGEGGGARGLGWLSLGGRGEGSVSPAPLTLQGEGPVSVSRAPMRGEGPVSVSRAPLRGEGTVRRAPLRGERPVIPAPLPLRGEGPVSRTPLRPAPHHVRPHRGPQHPGLPSTTHAGSNVPGTQCASIPRGLTSANCPASATACLTHVGLNVIVVLQPSEVALQSDSQGP